MDQLLIISSYPSKGVTHDKKTVGIASYAKNTLLGIKEANPDLYIDVLAEKLEEEKSYTEDGIDVKRVWERGKMTSFIKLFNEARKNQSKHILIEFEVSMFGNALQTSPLPFLILLLRLFGKNVTVVLHQAITDLDAFEGHTNISAKSVKSKFLSFAIKSFYFLLFLASNKIIVFEKSLKNRFSDIPKIHVIPHGVQIMKRQISQAEARNKLNIRNNAFVILIFGYVAWYKGTDWIVDQVNKLKNEEEFKNTLLIIGGGPNPNHENKKFYMDYVGKVIKNSENSIAKYTGFVNEDEISFVYEASDLVILPYRTFMSASGPLSLAYSFEKPALVSNRLSEIFETQDIKDVIEKNGLTKEDLSFDLTEESFKNIIIKAKDKEYLRTLEKISREISEKRSFKAIGKMYSDVIFSKNEK